MLHHFMKKGSDPTAVGSLLFKFVRLGGSGVDLFFVLSGFLITGILFDSRQNEHYFRTFYLRRTLRIFPLYYGMLLISFVILPWFHVKVDREALQHHGWLWFYGTNLIQTWKDSLYFGHYSHFWSLAVEEHFYFLWPIVIYSCNRIAGMWACGACAVLAFLCRLALAWDGDNAVGAYVFTPCRLDALATGAWIALAVRGPGDQKKLAKRAVTSLIPAVGAFVFLFFTKISLTRMDQTVLVVRSLLCAWVFGVVVLVAVARPLRNSRLWNSKALCFFGKYSYGLYVFHYPLVPWFERVFRPDVLVTFCRSGIVGQFIYAIFATLVSVMLALVSWHCYEKHFLRLKNVFAPNSTGPEAAYDAESNNRQPEPAPTL
jgi:peptidoglycan/LPS O-acetylase OafA/YrhL